MRIQKVLSEGFQLLQRFFCFVFLVDGMEGRIEMPLKMGHQRPASKTSLKWRFSGGPTMAQHWMLAWKLCTLTYFVIFRRSGSILLGNPVFLWFFRGGGGIGHPAPPLWIRPCKRSQGRFKDMHIFSSSFMLTRWEPKKTESFRSYFLTLKQCLLKHSV